jgi:hypothetical protein
MEHGMKKLILASVFALGLATTQAGAVNITFSDINGVPNQVFGTVTAQDLGPQPSSTDTVRLTFSIPPPPFLIDVGSHFLLTMSLTGTGRFDQSNIQTLNNNAFTYTVQPHLDPPLNNQNGYSNGTFKQFSDAIAGACGSGGSSGGCGNSFIVDVINFQGFAPATTLFNGSNSIFGALDIQFAQGQTGTVGFGGDPCCTRSVPGPIVGAGVPGLISACLGLWGFNYRRRKRYGLA